MKEKYNTFEDARQIVNDWINIASIGLHINPKTVRVARYVLYLENELSSRPVTDAAQELTEEIDNFKDKRHEEIIKDIDALERVARIGGLEMGYTLQGILKNKKEILKNLEDQNKDPDKRAKEWLDNHAPVYVLSYIDSLKIGMGNTIPIKEIPRIPPNRDKFFLKNEDTGV